MQGMRGKMDLSVSVKGADVTWLGGELSLESDAPALESQLYSTGCGPRSKFLASLTLRLLIWCVCVLSHAYQVASSRA